MRGLVLGLAVMVATALPVAAATPEEVILAALEAQGFHLVERYRTWLGRVRLIVVKGEVRREIVFYPATGEVLRDYATAVLPDRPATGTATAGGQVLASRGADDGANDGPDTVTAGDDTAPAAGPGTVGSATPYGMVTDVPLVIGGVPAN